MNSSLIETERLSIAVLSLSDAEDIQAYYNENAAHLGPWEPQRSPQFYELDAIRTRISESIKEREDGRSLKLNIRTKDSRVFIGVCNFTNIIRGPFQACTLGYSISASAQGKGMMFEALQASIDYMFVCENLHRIMANYMPENERSGRLLA